MLQFEEQRLRLTAVEKDIKELGEALGLDYLRKEIESCEIQAAAPGFWDDLEKAQEIQQKTSRLKEKVEKYERLVSGYEDTLVLIEMADEEGDLSMLDEIVASVDEALQSLEEQRLACLWVNTMQTTRSSPSTQVQAVPRLRTGPQCLSECTPIGVSVTALR